MLCGYVMSMGDIIWFLWIYLTAFLLGRWSMQRSIRWKLGDSIIEQVQGILDQRRFTGDRDFTISATKKWKTEGHTWDIKVSQSGKG